MPKDLTGTNVFVQKESSAYAPVFLVDIFRDHPETGESPYRACSWTKQYAIGGNIYLDLLKSLGDVRMSIPPGGGVAVGSDWTFSLVNPVNLPAGGRLSDMLDSYPLENDDVVLSLVFKTGSEGAGDILKIFKGNIQDPENDTDFFTLSVRDGTRSTLKAVPQEITDLVRYPHIPLNNVNIPLPVPFGSLNVEPFNASGARPRLASCLCTNFNTQEYAPGLMCKSYGQPYVYYPTARFYGKILDYTQAGPYFTIDSARRYSKIRPIRPLISNDVSSWQQVMDGNLSAGASLGSGSNLDMQMSGSPQLGTISAAEIRIEASGSFNYTIQKLDESDIAGSATGGTSVSLASWDLSNWDLEQIKVLIDGTGSATVYEITLDLTFDEQESGDRLAFPVFQAVVGYEDLASRYQDGGVVNTSGLALTNPLDVILALDRDRRAGMRMPIAEIYTGNIAAERAKIADWKFDFSLTEPLDEVGLDEFLVQGKIRKFRTYDGQWKFNVFDKTVTPTAFFSHETNINVLNPEAPPDQQKTTLRVYKSPLPEIYNEIVLRYGWDPALKTFTEIEIRSPHYLVTGTGTLSRGAGTLTDPSATFVTDGVQVGYVAFMTRDKAYRVTSVNGETELGVTPVSAGSEVSNRADVYYVGPNFDYRCFRSVAKYKVTQRLTIESRFIQDQATARLLIDHLVDYHGDRRTMVNFRTGLNAVDVELADLIIVDHPDLQPEKRPAFLKTLSSDVLDSDTTFPITDNGASLFRAADVVVIKAADANKLVREVVRVESVDRPNGEIDVTRGQAGTASPGWSAGDEVYRSITKFEVVEIKLMVGELDADGQYGGPEIEITARETPPSYRPIGHVSANGTRPYTQASAEERARSGFVCYQNGEVVWNRPESAISFVGA